MVGASGSLSFLIPVMSQRDVKFVRGLGSELEQRGHEVTYIPQNERLTLRDSKKHIDDSSLFFDHISSPPEKSLSELLETYEIEAPQSLVFPQMVYDYQYTNVNHRPFLLGADSVDYGPYFDILHRTLDALDGLYEDGCGPVPIQHQGGEVLRRSLQRVAETHGVQSVWVGNSPVDGYSGLYDDEHVNWRIFDGEGSAEMTNDDRERAHEYVNHVREQKPFTGKRAGKDGLPPQFETEQTSTIDRIRRLFSPEHDSAAMIGDWLRGKARRTGRRMKGRLAGKIYLSQSQSERAIQEKQFVFLPLQLIRESRVTVRSPPYYDIVWLVEYLSRSLPHGYHLVVKDHPDFVGALPLKTMRKITQFADVLHPDVNSHRVIEASDLVVTLNNTVGYEAILYGEPVVALGSAYYDQAGSVRKVENINDLPAIVNQAIDSGGLSDEEILQFAHQIFEGSYPGEWFNASEANFEQLVASIFDYLTQENVGNDTVADARV